MFSTSQKREIAAAVQQLLRATGHRELPVGEIQFCLSVAGSESWSYAEICNQPDVRA